MNRWWINFFLFVQNATQGGRAMLMEPIISAYVLNFIPLIAQLFVVPVLTMRLLSEEKRTGTLEMLLTAPVNETTVLVSKFLAAWLFYEDQRAGELRITHYRTALGERVFGGSDLISL